MIVGVATPRISVSQITTLGSTFADDVRWYAEAGLDGLGVWELKLGEDGDAAALEQLQASGLESAAAVPVIPSILPLPLLGGPDDPAERVDAYCKSLERLAPFRPTSVVCLTGTGEGREPDEARTVIVDGLKTIGAEAARLGLRIGLEPYQRIGGTPWSTVFTIPEAVELIEDAGDPAAVGLQFDSWHLWNTPTLYDDIAREIDRIVGVHIADYHEPRAWADRAVPGEGIADLPRILRALDAAGWTGLYDIELFSDDGTFEVALPGSLWAVTPSVLLHRARTALERCFEASAVA
jgi:sugar phosphate isomerase/epimerase